MRPSLIISLLIHAAILLAAVVVLPSPDKFAVEDEESIPVDIVSIEELSKRQATQKVPDPVPVVKPAPPKPDIEEKKPEPKRAEEVKKAELEPKIAPEPEPAPEVKPPDPKPIEELILRTENEQPKDEPKQAEVPAVKPKPRPQKPKKKVPQLDTAKISALLNKIDDDQASPPKLEQETGTPAQGTFDMATGSDARLSANEIDWLRQRLRECWNPPIGVMEAENLTVEIKVELDQGGAVRGAPAVANSSGHPLFAVAADSALRAVLRCQPFDRLPVEKYDIWRSLILNFNPREMFAG